MKKKFIMLFKKYGKYRWVKSGELVGGWGIIPNYDPIITVGYCNDLKTISQEKITSIIIIKLAKKSILHPLDKINAKS